MYLVSLYLEVDSTHLQMDSEGGLLVTWRCFLAKMDSSNLETDSSQPKVCT